MKQIRVVLGDAVRIESGAPTTSSAPKPTNTPANWPSRRGDLPPSRAEGCSMRLLDQLEEMTDVKSWNRREACWDQSFHRLTSSSSVHPFHSRFEFYPYSHKA